MPRIVIVGAGIAGLNAALTLQDADLSCEIYEAANRVGGRMHSDSVTWTAGLVGEWCGEFIDSDHETLHQLIRRFDLKTVDLGSDEAGRSSRLLYFLNHYCREEEFTRGLQLLTPILRQQMQEVAFPTTCTRYTETAYRLDHLSIADWIEQYVEGGQASLVGRLLKSGCTGYFGLDIKEQSSLNLLYLFGFQALAEDMTFAHPLQGSSKIVGGNQLLPLAIARDLPAESIHLQHRLVALARASDDTLTLTFTSPAGTREVQCDRAILTLPFSTLRHVDCRQAGFDTLKQAAIAELGYGTISKLFLQFDQPFWYTDGPWPRSHSGFIITDLDVQTFWDASAGGDGSGALLVNYTSGHNGASYAPPTPYTSSSDAERIQEYARECLGQLEQVFPGITPHYTGKAALSYPTGDPFLQGSYSCWRVGQYTRFGGYEGTRQGPVHFAGEHCSLDFQGFMEGAAREGARAARELLEA